MYQIHFHINNILFLVGRYEMIYDCNTYYYTYDQYIALTAQISDMLANCHLQKK